MVSYRYFHRYFHRIAYCDPLIYWYQDLCIQSRHQKKLSVFVWFRIWCSYLYLLVCKYYLHSITLPSLLSNICTFSAFSYTHNILYHQLFLCLNSFLSSRVTLLIFLLLRGYLPYWTSSWSISSWVEITRSSSVWRRRNSKAQIARRQYFGEWQERRYYGSYSPSELSGSCR